MFEWIAGLIEKGGYLGLFFLTFIENVFPPIPSELVMPFGGYLAGEGKMRFWVAVSVGSLGATLGSLPLYYAGRKLGEERIIALVDHYGAWLTLSGKDVLKAKGWFDRHRGLAVFACRILPGIRGFIAVPAGIARMPLVQFLPLTLAGCFIWTLILATAGYYLGASFASLDKVMGPTSTVATIAVVLWLVWKVRQRKMSLALQKQSLDKSRS